MSVAIIAGGFDPFTTGHLDLVLGAKKAFDHVVVVVENKPQRQYAFTPEERLEMTRDCVGSVECLFLPAAADVADWAKTWFYGPVIVAGIRSVQDLQAEQQLAAFNLQHGVPTVWLPAKNSISSTAVRRMACDPLWMGQGCPVAIRDRVHARVMKLAGTTPPEPPKTPEEVQPAVSPEEPQT